MISGGVDTGWTFYTPYSTQSSHTNVIPAAIGIFITGFSSILTGLNFIVTIAQDAGPGMTWFRLPLFVWSHLRHQHHPAAGHARAGHDTGAARRRADAAASASSTRRWAAIRSCSSTCSGSTRTRPSTS